METMVPAVPPVPPIYGIRGRKRPCAAVRYSLGSLGRFHTIVRVADNPMLVLDCSRRRIVLGWP